MNQKIDITPTPRILRTLGDIPFEIWQCLAELADNSLDAFRESEREGTNIEDARVDVYWSTQSTPSVDREILVRDNGQGMTLQRLQDAARAGFSNSDPIHNLGLFGMGFNIATARLGDETVFISATKESSEWVGIKIDFADLIKSQTFAAPVVTVPKESRHEHGTKVIVRKLKEGVFGDLRRKEGSIRSRLETVYSPLLERNRADFYLQGTLLRPQPHCVWSESRFVVRRSESVRAVNHIDADLGDAWFDLERNRYMSEDEGAEYDLRESRAETIPEHIVRRSRRLKGWIGIQRYSHLSDFGIDFIRNGRKILIANKSIFSYENPDTGTPVPEYPIELGSTRGGRIVGELHVDYLIPTYQKNSFDTTDRAWRVTLEAVRGAGPILPKRRKALGYDGDNNSPLGSLVNAYRRIDPGTKNLALSSGVERAFFSEFRRNNPEYLTDEKWYRATQEADRERDPRGTPADPGEKLTDDPDSYGPSTDNEADPSIDYPSAKSQQPQVATSRNELLARSERLEGLSGKYRYKGVVPGFEVSAYKTSGFQVRREGSRVPFSLFMDGVEIDYFYDETHSLFAEYPITPKQILLQALAERFSLRDHGVSIQSAFLGLVDNHMEEERINSEALRQRAQAVMSSIKEDLPQRLGHCIGKALKVLREVPAEMEALAEILLEEDPELLEDYLAAGPRASDVLAYIPPETLIRLVEELPEEFMDGNVFGLPYRKISVGDESARARLQRSALDKVVTYLKDLRALLKGGGSAPSKSELIRYANTLAILADRMV